jgi:hypothetical protein
MTDIATLTERGKDVELQTCPAFTAASGERLSRSAAMWSSFKMFWSGRN